MNEARVLQAIVEIGRRHLKFVGPISTEDHLVRDLGLDSLRLLTLLVEVEDHFRVVFDENEEGTIETVGDLVSAILAKLAQKEPER